MTGAEFSDGEEDGCDTGGGIEVEIGSEDLEQNLTEWSRKGFPTRR